MFADVFDLVEDRIQIRIVREGSLETTDYRDPISERIQRYEIAMNKCENLLLTFVINEQIVFRDKNSPCTFATVC